MVQSPGNRPWDAVGRSSSTETYSQTVVSPDGSSAVETVAVRDGQDVASLPAWVQQQRLERLQNQQQRLLRQQERRERMGQRRQHMQERFEIGQSMLPSTTGIGGTPSDVRSGSQPLSPGMLEVTERWVDANGTEHISTTRTSAHRRN
jgi:transcription initiation factor TFIID subunit TAF12